MKKIAPLLFVIAIGILFTACFSPVLAQENTQGKTVNLYFFWGEGCPHCAAEKPFLEKMKEKYPELVVHDHEVWGSSDNRDLMIDFGKKLNATVTGVPFTVIGDTYVEGWLDESYTGAKIEKAIICALQNHCRDIGIELRSSTNSNTNSKEQGTVNIPEKLTLPLVGTIETKHLSLPILTIIIAALDGFNPCALWTLLFLIGLLLEMGDRRRMWILGGAFVLTSGVFYFLVLLAWLNLLLFIGYIFWVRIGIALFALGGGGYFLKEYIFNRRGGCIVEKKEERKKVFEKIKNLTQESHFWIALVGIIILAVAVNMVELICSAGLPAVYTQILTLSHLPFWQYYLYLLLYVFIFMLGPLIIFFTAMFTLQLTGISKKYSNITHLVGGIIMLIIGVLLIFKPEWLMFG